jgi:hypothetical protein
MSELTSTEIPHERHRRNRRLSDAQQEHIITVVTDVLRGKRRTAVFTSDGVQIREEVTGARYHPRGDSRRQRAGGDQPDGAGQ